MSENKVISAQIRAKIRENPSKKKGRGAFRYIKNRFFKGGLLVEFSSCFENKTFRC